MTCMLSCSPKEYYSGSERHIKWCFFGIVIYFAISVFSGNYIQRGGFLYLTWKPDELAAILSTDFLSKIKILDPTFHYRLPFYLATTTCGIICNSNRRLTLQNQPIFFINNITSNCVTQPGTLYFCSHASIQQQLFFKSHVLAKIIS